MKLFEEQVVGPALKRPRGVDRVRALCDSWIGWSDHAGGKGGCLFVTASVELDDREGGPRDFLVKTQQEWLNLLERTAGHGVEAGAFRSDLDCTQFAHEVNAICLGYHQAKRLMRDHKSELRAQRALARLIEDAMPDAAPK